MISAGQAKVDPYNFFFGMPSVEEQVFLKAGLRPQVTDPNAAMNLGTQVDQRKANAIMGQGEAMAQGAAASGAILGNMFSNIGSTLGNMNFGGGSNTGGVASYGQNVYNQSNQVLDQINALGNISPFGGQMQQNRPFGGSSY